MRPEKQEDREERIAEEAVVDCYGGDEAALGWYYYLENRMAFPFEAVLRKKRSILPKNLRGEFLVLHLELEDECRNEIWIRIRVDEDEFSIPLETISPVSGTEEMIEAIRDWSYWCDRGYRFC